MAAYVNDLPLPKALIAALECGAWKAPVTQEPWGSLFPNEKVHHPLLYRLEMIEKENAGWRNETSAHYLGHADPEYPPGDIDPAKSLLIADLGPDRSIALDYRSSMDRPSVVFISDGPDGFPRWVRIAADIEAFILALGLNGQDSVKVVPPIELQDRWFS